MPSHDPAATLERLRKAQRQLAEAAPGSPDHDRLWARVDDLAKEYRAAIDALRIAQLSLRRQAQSRRRT